MRFAGVGLLGLALAAGCGPARDAEDSPTPPAELREFTVEFDGGSLLVRKGECEDVDPATIREWADRAHRDLSAAWPDRADRFQVDRLVMYGMGDAITNKGKSVNGYWDRKRQTVVYKCGVEIVIRHELFHVWCDRARLPCNCTWIDHPDGFNLDCTPKQD
jgi:hypothetical protein